MSDDFDTPYFEGILADIEASIGIELTLKIAQEYAGGEVYLPARPREGQVLVTLIGLDAAQKLCKALGSGKVAIPASHFVGAGRRRMLAAKLRHQGYSLRETARIADVCERTVCRAQAATSEELPLFSYLAGRSPD